MRPCGRTHSRNVAFQGKISRFHQDHRCDERMVLRCRPHSTFPPPPRQDVKRACSFRHASSSVNVYPFSAPPMPIVFSPVFALFRPCSGNFSPYLSDSCLNGFQEFRSASFAKTMNRRSVSGALDKSEFMRFYRLTAPRSAASRWPSPRSTSCGAPPHRPSPPPACPAAPTTPPPAGNARARRGCRRSCSTG